VSVDQKIYDKFRSGEETAFSEIVNKYNKLVFVICKAEFESGRSDIHLKLLYGYNNVIEDVRSEVWISLLKSIKKGIIFKNEHSLKNLIRVITIRATKSVKRKSLRNRNPDVLSKSKKKSKPLKTLSNVFTSTDHRRYADQIDSLALNRNNDMNISEEAELDFDKIYAKISKNLSSRQQELCRLMKARLLKDENATHEYLAEKIGVSERTVRNDLEAIRKIYSNLDLSI
jgi:DNA-directed RNA polymerase specialized sigma24 family protein